MSFNIRLENNRDKEQNHWDNRKENVLKLITHHQPDIFGLQEASMNQIHFIEKYFYEKKSAFYMDWRRFFREEQR